MSDHNTGHAPHGDQVTHGTSYGAGHEMDVPPTKELFNIVWGLGALTLLSLVTCVQLFNNQQRDIMEERGKESSQVLAQYRQGMDGVTKSSGELSFKDSTGAEIKQRYVPLAVARDLVLAKPERLQAAEAPKGWMHPDDIAAGAAPGAGAPAGTAVQAPPGAGTVPEGTNPAEPGAIVPGNPGVNPGISAPGVPGADPKIDGATGAGAAAAPAGTAPANEVGNGAAPTDPQTAQPGVAPATGAGAGNGKADAGKSGSPAPVPAPAAPAPAPAPAAAPTAPAPAR